MTGSRWLRRAAASFAVTATAVAVNGVFPTSPAHAVPARGSVVCNHLIGMRDAYYEVYLSTRYDESLLAVVGRFTWDATDSGGFGTEPALRQRAFAPSSMPRP